MLTVLSTVATANLHVSVIVQLVPYVIVSLAQNSSRSPQPPQNAIQSAASALL
jgi:hypothetical protein